MVDTTGEPLPPSYVKTFLSWGQWGKSTTPWPLVWVGIQPGKYAFSGVTGKLFNFNIMVQPDPSWPDVYAAEVGGAGDGTGVPIPVDIPPPPRITKVEVLRPSGEYDPLTDSIWSINGETINVAGDSSDLLPYKTISILQNDVLYDHFKTVQELENFLGDNLDFILTGLVPRDEEFGEKYLIAKYTSDSSSTPTLEGNFWLQIYNDWNKVKVKVDELVAISKAYLERKAAEETPEGSDGQPPNGNSSTSAGFDNTTPEPDNTVDTIDKAGFSLDDAAREDDGSTFAKIDEENGDKSVIESIREKYSEVNTISDDNRTIDQKANDGDLTIEEIRNSQ